MALRFKSIAIEEARIQNAKRAQLNQTLQIYSLPKQGVHCKWEPKQPNHHDPEISHTIIFPFIRPTMAPWADLLLQGLDLRVRAVLRDGLPRPMNF